MENRIKELLDAEIENTLSTIVHTTDVESDAYRNAVSRLKILHEERIRELEAELKEKQRTDSDFAKSKEIEIRNAELEFKAQQAEAELVLRRAELDQKDAELKEAKKARRVKTVLEILGLAVPLGVSSFWMMEGMKFEEEGKIFSGRTGRWISEHLRLFGKKG